MKATFVRDVSESFTGTAHLYALDTYFVYDDEPRTDGSFPTANHIIVSATWVAIPGRDETYVFPANKDGEVLRWFEQPGSWNNSRDIEGAVRRFEEHHEHHPATDRRTSVE